MAKLCFKLLLNLTKRLLRGCSCREVRFCLLGEAVATGLYNTKPFHKFKVRKLRTIYDLRSWV